MTKLHHVANGSRVKVISPDHPPPSHREFVEGEELEFAHIDGMYSFCKDDNGNIVHLVAWAEVEVIREGYPETKK